VARIAAASVALASATALAGAGVAERNSVADSFTVLGHLHWLWNPAALLLESASIAAFAIMLCRLLAAGGASMGIRPMLATAYAANAVSVSVPLAGPAMATALTFRRFTRQGADAPLAGCAEPQHHARWPRGHRRIAQPGPGSDRAGYRPGPGRRAALSHRQLLAGRAGRMADHVPAAASASPPRSQSFAAQRPRTGHRHGR
jgi:hypothetical protein